MGLNTTLFKGALLWNKLPNHFKEAGSIIHFNNKIRKYKGGYVLVVSALKLSTFTKCTYVKKIISVVIYLYF